MAPSHTTHTRVAQDQGDHAEAIESPGRIENTTNGAARNPVSGQNYKETSHENIDAVDHASRSNTGSIPESVHAEPRNARPRIERGWQTERPKPTHGTSTTQNEIGLLKRRSLSHPAPGAENDSSQDNHSQDTSDSDSSSLSTGKKTRKRLHRHKSYSRFKRGNENYTAKGKVSKRDGRLDISVNETANSGYIAKALGQTIKHHLDVPGKNQDQDDHTNRYDGQELNADEGFGCREDDEAASIASAVHKTVQRPRLNIVIMVIGSRGDIQPFLQIGRVLKRYGHRVRIATHPAFKQFVEKDVGLEFFNVGGDPSELMAFMVKNPGLIPSMETVKQGEIARRRKGMAEMFEGFWRACINATDDEKDKSNLKMLGDRAPFIADAIIANPPSFAHVHIAERLGIPLHIMFTFPYSPTQAFPHPLANIKSQKSNVDANYTNFISYPLVELMTWQGLGDLVNKFRTRTLGLEPVSSLWAPGALFRMKVPYTYMWSPALVPKPKDWGPEIDIGGYVFLDLASNFKPPKELTDFLDAGEPPVYIGFGSIVVDDPDKFTKMIFNAVKIAGVRALVSKGWGGLGGDNVPENVFMLENTPHDWLFPRVKAVVHHGGAGTCAIGLKCAKPTMIVPFFGDQPFWGAMLAAAKAGAHESIPYKQLTAEKLAEGIKQCLTEEAQKNVQVIADSISKEGDGAENAVASFHRSLPLAGRHNMRCSILTDRVAVWEMKHSRMRLSAVAAEMLVEKKLIQWHDLSAIRHFEWNDFDGPGEPISGIGGALMDTGTNFTRGLGMVPVKIARDIKKRNEHDKRKSEKLERREAKRKAREASKCTVQTGKNELARDGELSNAQDQRTLRPTNETRPTNTTMSSTISADPSDALALDIAEDVGRGLGVSAGAIASMPLDLGIAMGQGFHNAPRLYGDSTVRKPIRITGFRTGAKAAGSEFVFGVYDGFTGLVTQPVNGWQDASSNAGKVPGLVKGFAKGLGGFVLKDVSALVAPPFMLMQGTKKEIKKRLGGPGTTGFIRRAHVIQGQKDVNALHEADEQEGTNQYKETQNRVLQGWDIMEKVWKEKEDYMMHHGGKTRGRLSLHREERKWVEHGALEDVDAASRALEAKRQGQDLEKVFARRKKEMKIAERPRAAAMDQPVDYEEGSSIAPNGQFKRTPHPDEPEATESPQQQHRNSNLARQKTPPALVSGKSKNYQDSVEEEGKSESSSDTAVESSDEGADVKAPSKQVGSLKVKSATADLKKDVGHHGGYSAGGTGGIAV